MCICDELECILYNNKFPSIKLEIKIYKTTVLVAASYKCYTPSEKRTKLKQSENKSAKEGLI
jgi:hypothetical protein